jgi:phosphinothricin acetyltransferase
VAELDGEVVGWVAVVPYSRRAVYRGVGEESVYVAERARGRGVGRALLEALVASARDGGLWTLQAGVFPENGSSLALHRALGFREVGRRERIAELGGVWRDVVLLELRL